MLCDIPVQQVSEILPESSIKSLDPLAATKILADNFSYTQAASSVMLFMAMYDVMIECEDEGAFINSSAEDCNYIREDYKGIVRDYTNMLVYLIETIEANWETAHNMSDGEPNQALQVYEYLHIAFDSFQSYLEYKNHDMLSLIHI